MFFKEVAKELNFPELEHKILSFWERNKIVDKYLVKNKNKGRKKWSFQDGPITANNPMGVHHAWGRTYKDVFQRYKTMKGFEQRYQNGFDCQGLWVEVEVERELGFRSKKDIEKYGIDKFVQKCKERVHKYSMVQTESSIRIGMWMDWGEWKTSMDDKDWLKKSHSYYTMSEVNNYTIWHFLKRCHERGFIYEGVDVMPWCARCGTAISDMEIATEGYQELTHKAVIVRFKLLDKKNEYLLVWTTTPWTLTSNTGVAVHPDLPYVKVKNNGVFYYLAKSLLKVLKGKYEIIEEFPGKKLLGLTYEGPFDYLPVQKNVVHKVIPWEEISESEGTGLVHIAPGCGKEDFALGKEFGLKTIAPLDELGIYIDGFDWLSGKDVKDVAPPIIEDLKKRGILYDAADYTHRYPVCWRCGSELIFRLVDEWFISMDTLRYEISEVTKKVERWIPSFGLARELDWLKNMSDWCISKKRYWGLALPIWKCKCGNFMIIGSRDELKEKAVEGWREFEGHSPHRPWIDKIKIKCDKCGALVSRIPDVGNPWLDAGIVPYSTIRPPDDMHNLSNGYPFNKDYWKEWFPADFITECFPGQFRNWFYAILTMSTVLENKPPFKVLLGYASLRDEHGEEMHKSKGNAIWSDEAAEKVGADVMRWMFAKHNPVQNLNFGYGPAKEIKRTLLTLWNVYSFFVTYANIDNFNPLNKKINEKALTKLDRWILSRLNSLILDVDKLYENYELMTIVKLAEKFFDDLSNWYVRRSRRRFWKSENDADKETAYLVLYECLVKLLKIISPIMPFWTEEMYQNLVRNVDKDAPPSIHLCDFPEVENEKIDEKLENEISLTRTIVSLGRAARNKVNIKIRQPLAEMFIMVPETNPQLSEADRKTILDELNIKSIKAVGPDALDTVYIFTATPVFEKLGPKFGKLANRVGDWIKSLSNEKVEELIKSGSLKQDFDGRTIEITKEDVQIRKKEAPEVSVMIEGEYGVGLKTVLTKELENEGMVRELIHKIQLLRKEADFNLVDRIKIFYQTEPRLKEAIVENLDYLKNETLATEVTEGTKTGEINKTVDINGIKAKINLRRDR
ncbi:MAG TPA: isoleucine--tRNA ligase [candidate division WOR-3 bacterium]|uniref:Isoleucine--tRNA ligase n=1 Tax=candidate division WOR-3 bacterium TaxID=2052148 RepID=A0A9C9EMN2_UNCW3|nr:isoleucine--tRNA ligase [candidate division WOR-3 bacterium]